MGVLWRRAQACCGNVRNRAICLAVCCCLQSVVSVLTREDYGGASMEELLCSKYASPFLQAVLKAASMLQGNRCARVRCTSALWPSL